MPSYREMATSKPENRNRDPGDPRCLLGRIEDVVYGKNVTVMRKNLSGR